MKLKRKSEQMNHNTHIQWYGIIVITMVVGTENLDASTTMPLMMDLECV